MLPDGNLFEEFVDRIKKKLSVGNGGGRWGGWDDYYFKTESNDWINVLRFSHADPLVGTKCCLDDFLRHQHCFTSLNTKLKKNS